MDTAQEPNAQRRCRKRPSRACHRCRSKKDRCDGTRPTCRPCRNAGQSCRYEGDGDGDGHSVAASTEQVLPPEYGGAGGGGYVRGLEQLLGLAISHVDGLEVKVLRLLGVDSQSAASTGSDALDDEDCSTRQQRVPSGLADENGSENWQEAWRSSELCAQLEKEMMISSVTETDNPASTARSGGQTAVIRNSYGFPPSYPTPDNSRPSFRVGAEDNPDILADAGSPRRKRMKLDHADKQQDTDVIDLALPPEAPQLLESYFSYTHTWFPVVTKHAILRTSYLYSAKPMRISRTTPGSGDHAALWAILSYVTAQSRPRQAPPSSSSSSLHQPGFFEDPVSKVTEFYTNARTIIPMEEERFELGHIQALLVLTLVNFGVGDWNAAWLLSGQATRLAIGLQNGAISSCCSTGVPPAGQVSAVVLGCFVVDTILSVRLKAAPHVRTDDITLVPLLVEDGLEEWGPWSDVLSSCQSELPGGQSTARGPLLSLSCFNRLVEIAILFSRIARQDPSGPGAPSFCQSMLQEIQTWHEKLPANCRLGEADLQGLEKVPPFLLPHQSFLCLTYLGIVSFFHMRFSAHLPSPSSSLTRENALHVGTIILAAHAKNFGPAVLPPILEHSARMIIDGAKAAPPTRQEATQRRFSVWLECMNRYTTKTARVWPVMRSLQPELSKGPVSAKRRSHYYPPPASCQDEAVQPSLSDRAGDAAARSDGPVEPPSDFRSCPVGYDDLFQTDQDDALLDILGFDWNFNPQSNTTANHDENGLLTTLSSNIPTTHQQESGTLHMATLDDLLASPGAQPPTFNPDHHPNTKLSGTNDNGPTQLSTPESMTSIPSAPSRHPQPAQSSQNQTTTTFPPHSRAKRPAPNEIESIFDNQEDVSDSVPEFLADDVPPSSPRRPIGSPGHRRRQRQRTSSSHATSFSDHTNSNPNAIADKGQVAVTDQLDLDEQLASPSGSAAASGGFLLAPPSIGDLWPPPGFFPTEEDERRGGRIESCEDDGGNG